MILLLLLNQIIQTVKRGSSVIADDSSASVGVRKTGNESKVSRLSHFRRVGLEHAVIVGSHIVEQELNVLGKFFTVLRNLFPDHFDSAKGADSSFQRFIRLQSHDDVFVLVNVPGLKCVDPHDSAGVHLQRSAVLPLSDQEILHLFIDLGRPFRGSRQEAAVAVVLGEIQIDEIIHKDLILPEASLEPFPFFSHTITPFSCLCQMLSISREMRRAAACILYTRAY